MIRYALKKDIPKIEDLLSQVCLVHNNGRPDIFKVGTKYSEEELKILLKDESRPILVSVDEKDEVMGYCFCIFKQHTLPGALAGTNHDRNRRCQSKRTRTANYKNRNCSIQ